MKRATMVTLALAVLAGLPSGARTVAFLGGSITQMEGYRPRMERYFREKFPDEKFAFIEAGLSSLGSTSHAFRFHDDVLAKGVPDVLFYEAAVNDDQDEHASYRRCVQGAEGVIRQALIANPKMRIVIVLFVNKGEFSLLQRGKEPVPYAAHKTVARHYGLEVADVGSALVAADKAGTMTWAAYKDCHPSPEGCDFGTKVVVEAFERTPGPMSAALPEPLDAGSFCPAGFVGFGLANRRDGDWQYSLPDWSKRTPNVRPEYAKYAILWCDKPGATCVVPFAGKTFGAFVLAGPKAGILEVSIDGGPFAEYDLFHGFSRCMFYPRSVIFAEDLADGAHEATLRVSPKRNPASEGTEAMIYRLEAGVPGGSPDWTFPGGHQPGGVKPREVTRTARGVPSDATVIYDETHPSLEQLVNIDGGPCRWKIQPDGTLLVSKEGNRSNKVLASAYTRDEYSDFQLHVEYLIPTSVLEETEPRRKLTRGNSGIKIFGRYEVQIIDSYRNEQDPVGTSGAVYANRAPLVNACLPPGEWQSYDIVFRAPRVKDGKVLKRASLTVLANGVLVQDHVEPPPYPNDGMSPLVTKGRVEFQSHNDKSPCISFRNIWIRPLKQ